MHVQTKFYYGFISENQNCLNTKGRFSTQSVIWFMSVFPKFELSRYVWGVYMSIVGVCILFGGADAEVCDRSTFLCNLPITVKSK